MGMYRVTWKPRGRAYEREGVECRTLETARALARMLSGIGKGYAWIFDGGVDTTYGHAREVWREGYHLVQERIPFDC